MGVVVLPKSLTAKTEAKAADVMADLNAIATQVNGNLDLENLIESVRNALVPTGTVLATARSSAPTGYLLCQGQAVSRTTYAVLFAAIGTTFGSGDGVTTFNLPDLRGRVPVGVDAGIGRHTTLNLLGQAGGHQSLQAHTHGAGSMLTGAESALHHHNIGWFGGQTRHEGTGFAYGTNVEVGGTTATGDESANHIHAVTGNTASTGSGNGENMPPFQTLNWMVKI
jgi:microcystin-dependent protein